jgi:carboxylesterase type B
VTGFRTLQAWLHTASNGPARPFGPAHVTDLPYWFDTLHQMPGFVPTPREVTLANAISRSLLAFAATGDPNYSSEVKWPRYDAATDAHTALDDTITVGSGFHSQRCDFWDTHLPPAGYRATP